MKAKLLSRRKMHFRLTHIAWPTAPPFSPGPHKSIYIYIYTIYIYIYIYFSKSVVALCHFAGQNWVTEIRWIIAIAAAWKLSHFHWQTWVRRENVENFGVLSCSRFVMSFIAAYLTFFQAKNFIFTRITQNARKTKKSKKKKKNKRNKKIKSAEKRDAAQQLWLQSQAPKSASAVKGH